VTVAKSVAERSGGGGGDGYWLAEVALNRIATTGDVGHIAGFDLLFEKRIWHVDAPRPARQ